jgi:uncharacterized membrane protein YhaH (DUF805 family)
MKYVGDIDFWICAALSIAAIVVLISSVRLKGKSLLLGFIVLLWVSHTGFYFIHLMLRNEVITYETYRKFMEPVSLVFTLVRVAGWALLLGFVVSLKAVQQTFPGAGETRVSSENMTIARALFSFEGRLCRSDYWLKGFLPMLPLGIINNILAYGVAEDWARILSMLLAILSFWPALALIVKRLHDRDKSGWFALIMLIPIVGPLLLLVGVWFMKGTDGPNRFGPDPLQPTATPAIVIAGANDAAL